MSVCLSLSMPICRYVCLSIFVYVHMSICRFLYHCLCPDVHPSFRRPSIHPSIHMFVSTCVCPCVHHTNPPLPSHPNCLPPLIHLLIQQRKQLALFILFQALLLPSSFLSPSFSLSAAASHRPSTPCYEEDTHDSSSSSSSLRVTSEVAVKIGWAGHMTNLLTRRTCHRTTRNVHLEHVHRVIRHTRNRKTGWVEAQAGNWLDEQIYL